MSGDVAILTTFPQKRPVNRLCDRGDLMFRRSEPPFSRRELFKLAAAGVGAASLSGWVGPLAAGAAADKKHKACVVLWMDGGPSHIDTFDPKPDARADVRGEFKAIPTAVPGIHVS